MRELKIIQDDDGMLSIETAGDDGQPVVTSAGTIDEAIEQIKGQLGAPAVAATEGSEERQEPAPVDETGPVAASKGKKLEDNLPVVDKEKRGTLPRKSADWSDYSL